MLPAIKFIIIVNGFRGIEIDRLGGKDPYSASKAMAENVFTLISIRTLRYKYKIGIVRAGNVIGGGDWAKNRLIPDCIRRGPIETQ